MNITMLLDMAAAGMGERVGVGPSASGSTYAAMLDHAQRMATVVLDRDAERVVYIGLNTDIVPTLLFASAAAGVPFAPVNFRLADDRLRAVLAMTAPSIAVVDDDVRSRVEGIDGVSVVSCDEMLRLAEGAAPFETTEVDPEQVAIWLFTSGTSGDPKAALLRHRHLVSYVLSTVDFMAADDDQAALVSVPAYHIAGMATILSATYSGRRLVYLPQFDPKRWVTLAAQEGITHAMVVPTMLGRLLDAIEEMGVSLPALRHLSYGGGRMPLPTIERAMALLPTVDFVNAYGLTETSSTVAVLGPEDHRVAAASDDPAVRARLASVGRPLPTLELEIRDDEGTVVPVGESGEIFVRGDQIAGEYRGRSALDADGWFATNDGGHLDEGGFLFVEGRLDDVIVRGGENLSPGEIEDVLLTHPAVAEAGVTGIPSVEWGETVAAAVVLDEGSAASSAELQEWVRDHLRSARTPTIIDIRETLPISDTGKLLRRVLKQELAELAGDS